MAESLHSSVNQIKIFIIKWVYLSVPLRRLVSIAGTFVYILVLNDWILENFCAVEKHLPENDRPNSNSE